ncbi:Bro-N domain-containing protein [Pseudomonas cavernicola]|uniref:BRO-N domain-containing protein n=1 Tax=Pseudomonas cavernicola TaxID=2320866 RepID=UPI001EE54885|nr:Bro-N domain-containing protein [Pseudomonas cavernicola]
MHDAYIPPTFLRYNRPLRGLMIDNQPWFAARDFGLLIGHRHPERICRLADDDQLRTVHFAQASGDEEVVEMISESAIYRAFYRFSHPELRGLRRWLTH